MPTTKITTPQGVAISQLPPQENSWLALCATSKKAARQGDSFVVCSELVALYSKARTHFIAKS